MSKKKMNNETLTDRFKRIATKRANRLLDDLRLLGNCSNKGVYSYTDEQIRQIFRPIEKELKRVKQLFGDHAKKRIRL